MTALPRKLFSRSQFPRMSRLSCAILLGTLGTSGMVHAAALEEVIVTAQKREVGLQDTALSISAFSGDSLKENTIFNAGDLARSTAGFSFTNPTPFDMELNIRGVMNTRLDAPSASRSIGVFMDEVIVGRMGLMSMDFYDIERVEILRGPQGVLLGKNVVGGALNIITAKPEFERSGDVQFQAGNLDSFMGSAHITGGLSDTVAARLAVQFRKDDGFAKDLRNGNDLHDRDTLQARLQFLYEGENDLSANLSFEFMDDEGGGTCAIGEGGNPWSVARDFVGLNNIRFCLPEEAQYSTGTREQGFERDAQNITLNIEKGFDGFTLNSITGYRQGEGESMYSQTGIGPDAPGIQDAFFGALGAFIGGDASAFGTVQALGLAFDFPVREEEELSQFSQELRLTSNGTGKVDWIAGAYYQKDEVDKFDRFWGETLLNVIGAVGSLNGESTWDNRGEVESFALFGQVGYQMTDAVKLTVGGRYTKDEISGNITGVAVETGDKFSPDDPTPLTPLTGEPDGMGGLTPFPEGGGFSTPYEDDWDEFTLQGILEWQVNDDVMLYGSISEGFKSGGFQDTPPSTLGATLAYEPETVTSYELGIKSEGLDGRLRANGALFYMDYKDLQVEFTNDQCLCNIVSNASDASIKGVEMDLTFAATDSLLMWLSGSYVDTEYEDYVISTGDFSGNQLQRTPEFQINGGFEYTADLGQWRDALAFRVNYTWQDDMPWAHTNVAWEDDFGLLDARISLSPVDAPWGVAIFGRNLTDEDVKSNVIEFLGGVAALYSPPRTYGVEVSWSF